MKILVAEPVHFDEVHVRVNSAFLAMLATLYGGAQIEMVAEKAHAQALKQAGGPVLKEVKWFTFRKYSNEKHLLYWVQKITGEWRLILRVVRKARKENYDLIFWTCLFPTGHFFLRLLTPWLLARRRQIVVLHGELEYFNEKNHRFVERMLRFFLRKALTGKLPRVHYIVLGENIRRHLNELIPGISGKLFSLEHPFGYASSPFLAGQTDKSTVPVRVCTFGALKKGKGSHLFWELAMRMEPEIRAGKITFHAIGNIADFSVTDTQAALVEHTGGFVPQSLYEQLISACNLALFFYDADDYRFTASGALHEAIALQVPIVAFPNSYFREIWKTEHPPGLLVHSLEEMEAQIRYFLSLRNENAEVLKKIKDNVSAFCQQKTFVLQTEKFREVLELANQRS